MRINSGWGKVESMKRSLTVKKTERGLECREYKRKCSLTAKETLTTEGGGEILITSYSKRGKKERGKRSYTQMKIIGFRYHMWGVGSEWL